MIHEMTLWAAPFEAIRDGSKDIELRLHDPKRQAIQAGDTIVFHSKATGETLTCLVVEKHLYPTFEELYRHFDKVRMGYTPDEVADPADMEIYYSKEDIATWGVCGIEIRLTEESSPKF